VGKSLRQRGSRVVADNGQLGRFAGDPGNGQSRCVVLSSREWLRLIADPASKSWLVIFRSWMFRDIGVVLSREGWGSVRGLENAGDALAADSLVDAAAAGYRDADEQLVRAGASGTKIEMAS
jgi:hypothetical protein